MTVEGAIRAGWTGWALLGFWLTLLVPVACLTGIAAVVISSLVGITTGGEMTYGWFLWAVPIITTIIWAFCLPAVAKKEK